MRYLIICFSFLAAVAVYSWMPAREIPGSDTETYAIASRGIRNNTPMLDVYGNPYVQWGPLYPVLLAPFDHPYTGARVLNVVAFTLTMAFTLLLARRYLSPAMTAATGVALLISPPLQTIHLYALSEPLFIAFVTAFLWTATGNMDRHMMAGMSILAALALLQRLVGVILIPFGVVLILWQYRRQRAHAAVYAAAYALLPTIAYAAWALHGIAFAGHSGPPALPIYNLYQASVVSGFTVSTWLPVILFPLLIALLTSLVLKRRSYANAQHRGAVLRTIFRVDGRFEHADSRVVSKR